MSEPTIAACLAKCRKHQREPQYRKTVRFVRTYFAANRNGTPVGCERLAADAGLDPTLVYLIAVIVWELWKAWWRKRA